MNNSEFLKILGTFPGKRELINQEKEEIILMYRFFDFAGIMAELKKGNVKIRCQNSEEVWYKILAFFAIASESLKDSDPHVQAKELFVGQANKYREYIIYLFNEKFFDSRKVIKDLEEIRLEEIIEFVNSRKPLLP